MSHNEQEEEGSIATMFLLLVSLFCFAAMAYGVPDPCPAPKDREVLGFDDYALSPGNYNTGLPQPYHDFNFSRGGGWTYKNILLLNSTGSEYYGNSASSSPNIILTQGEQLFIALVETKFIRTFKLISVTMTPIFKDNLLVYIEMFRDNVSVQRMEATLPLQVRTTVVMTDAVAGDKVTIGCVAPDANSFIAYDDFAVCYKH